MKNFFVVAIFIASIYACKSNKPAATPKENGSSTDLITKSAGDSNLCRLVIRFYSPGSGAEFKFINAFEDSIGSYSLYFGKNVDYKKNSWGPEGETDFCLKLNELNVTEQKEFIIRSKAQLEQAKFVHIYENSPCPDVSGYKRK